MITKEEMKKLSRDLLCGTAEEKEAAKSKIDELRGDDKEN